jgi:hypothetical protein
MGKLRYTLSSDRLLPPANLFLGEPEDLQGVVVVPSKIRRFLSFQMSHVVYIISAGHELFFALLMWHEDIVVLDF